ncbi:MAG TPA: hypothetical protein VHE59_13890 [Mucilaginibacter sp.]|nr:hypothetical protein [Mucilaginibacter sp.]
MKPFYRIVITCILIALSYTPTYSLQDSKIKVDSGNKNDVTVVQNGADSSQKSDVSLIKTSENKIRIKQDSKKGVAEPIQEKGIMHYLNNAYVIFGLIASLITIGIFMFKLIKHKKRVK